MYFFNCILSLLLLYIFCAIVVLSLSHNCIHLYCILQVIVQILLLVNFMGQNQQA